MQAWESDSHALFSKEKPASIKPAGPSNFRDATIHAKHINTPLYIKWVVDEANRALA